MGGNQKAVAVFLQMSGCDFIVVGCIYLVAS